jgi:hypothetical protein
VVGWVEGEEEVRKRVDGWCFDMVTSDVFETNVAFL